MTMVFMSFGSRLIGSRLPARTGVALAAALVLGSCGAGGAGGGSGDGPSVVAGFYPLAFVAERVAGDAADVADLTTVGAEPHDLELRPKQVVQIADADVVVYEAALQPQVAEAVESNAQGTTIEVGELAGLEHEGDDGHDHGGDQADDQALDPHLWLDPTKLVPVARAIADGLAEADPEHAGTYHRNAGRLIGELHRLDDDFRRGLSDCDRRTFVTSHAAFGYLAHAYDLRMLPIAGISPDAEPSPARLAELRQVVRDEGVTTIFTERLASTAIADTLARAADVEVAVLDPIEGLTDQTRDEDYLSLMRQNLAALRTANGCR